MIQESIFTLVVDQYTWNKNIAFSMNFDIIFQESGPFWYSQQFRQSTTIKKTYKEAN